MISRNTREAMRSGVVLGEVARIDGMLDMVLAEMRATKAAGRAMCPSSLPATMPRRLRRWSAIA
ncbi:MAG: hypothetical protein ACLU37_01440 [Collinsella sp.]